MSVDAAKNFAKGNLAAGYDSAATSISLTTGKGALFPAAPFNAVWYNATDYSDPNDDPSVEIIRVTAKSGDSLTVTRAQEGTSAANHNTAGRVYTLIAGPTALLLSQIDATYAAKATTLAGYGITDGVRSVGVTAPVATTGGINPTISVAVTAADDGGAVAKQASTPGTQQTGHANLSGTVKAGVLDGPATGLKSATTTVDVSAATAPSSGQVLTGTDSTHATWQAPAAATALKSATTSVDVAAASAPSVGKVLKATDSTHATWQDEAVQSVGGTSPVASSGGATPSISIAITAAADGGAVAKQATTPGTQQTGNVNLSGKALLGQLELAAGGTAAGSAPLKLTSQANPLTAVEQGTFELVGNSLQFSQLVRRRGVAMSQGVLLSDVTVGNSGTESAALITASHGANYLEVGKCEEIVLRGVIKQRSNPSAYLTVRVKYAGVTVQTWTTPSATAIAAGTPFEIRVYTTCRSVGASGSMQINSILWIDGITNSPDAATLVSIDTTTAQDTTVTAQWSETDVNDTLTINQGRVLCIEPNR